MPFKPECRNAEALGRAVGRRIGLGTRFVRNLRRMRREDAAERLKELVRRHPATLAGAAAAGFLLGRALRGK